MIDRSQLEPLLTPERLERIRTVLESRVKNVTVVLENLHKDYNMSAVLRTCESFGIQEVHVIPQPGEGKVYSSVTQGCHRWLTIRRHEDMRSCFLYLRQRDYRILAGALGEGSRPLDQIDWSGKVAIVFSNELEGAGKDVLDRVDSTFIIPMSGFSQSLNVSVAAGIVIHHAMREKGRTGDLERIPGDQAEEIYKQWVRKSVRGADVVIKELEKRG
jgi:tRNA (guanosine-2'-O-)-methyltransferase